MKWWLARVGLCLLALVGLSRDPGIVAPARAAGVGECMARAGTIVAVDFAHWGGPIVRGCAINEPSGYALLHAAGFTTAGDSHDGTTFICRLAGWAALGLAAEGSNPADVRRGGHSLLGYIQATVATDPGSLERTILVARAAGVSATEFGGRDLVVALQRDIRRNGSVADQVNLTAFAVLALRAASVSPPPRMLRWLVDQQDADGGFSFATAGDQADVDDTGAALEALADTAPAASRRAVAYIRAAENPDGGFPSQPGANSNAQSTAWAVQGLIAAGIAPGSLHDHGSRSPLQYLNSLITPTGAIDYARATSQTPVWVTAEALMALAGKPLPLAPVRVDPHRQVPAAPTPSSTPFATDVGIVVSLLLALVAVDRSHPVAARAASNGCSRARRLGEQRGRYVEMSAPTVTGAWRSLAVHLSSTRPNFQNASAAVQVMMNIATITNPALLVSKLAM